MSRSSIRANGRQSETTPSSFARAAYCRRRFSRALGSKSRPNMAPLKLARVLLIGALVHALASGFGTAIAQQVRDDAAERAIDSALGTGNYGQAAALLTRMANAGSPEAQYELASLYRSGRGVPLDVE